MLREGRGAEQSSGADWEKAGAFFQPLTAGVGCLALEVMRQCENLLLSSAPRLHELPACHSYRCAPMSGKTTVAYRLAAILGYGCLSTDDLGEAIRAVTTKDSHPHLHPMDGYGLQRILWHPLARRTYSRVSLEHRALWPAVERVIRKHATWGAPSVIEGWSLWPERVTQLRAAQRALAVVRGP